MNPSAENIGIDEIPQYGTKPKKPGLCLGLFHGRHEPRERMNGWGFDGPAIGPLRWCHTTYATDISIVFENATDAVQYFGVAQEPFDLKIDADLQVFNGKYYGDWTVYYVGPEDCERPPDGFRETRRINDSLAHKKYFFKRSNTKPKRCTN